jgi:RHH-type proline utilization regulon transcriptional repressor/proline dehydrogenase/delta 1-pyrroline-5-carboxylate dehydrogenase
MSELVPRLVDLARQAKSHDLNFTVDAEEADRLELSLDAIAALGDSSLAGWGGFGRRSKPTRTCPT